MKQSLGKTARNELQGESLYRALAANLPGGAAFVVDHELRYLLAEGQALAEAGMSSADFEGKTIFEALEPELARAYELNYRQALAGKPFQTEHRLGGRSFASHGRPLYDGSGEIYAALEVSYDITFRNRAEAALHESEEKYRTLFETIDEGFCIIEMIYDAAGAAIDFRFLEINQVFKRQTGIVNAVGKLCSEIAPNAEPYWLETYDKVARTGEAVRLENYNQDAAHWYYAYV